MNESHPKPEQFGIAIKGEDAHIKRHFEFASGTIDLDIQFKTKTPMEEMTVRQLDQASLRLAIKELERLLNLSQLSR